MSTHLYQIVLAAVLSLSFNWASAQTTTGKQCKDLLTPVSNPLFSYQNRSNYYKINNEIPNVVGSSLESIAQTESSNPIVQTYINAVSKALKECQQTCQGLPLQNGRNVKCDKLGSTNPMGVRYGVSQLIDDAEVKAETMQEGQVAQLPSAQCAFEPDAEGCQIEEEIKEEPKKVVTVDPSQYSCEGDESSEGCREIPVINSRPINNPVKATDDVRRSNGFEYHRVIHSSKSVEVGI